MKPSFFDEILAELSDYLSADRMKRVDDGGRYAQAISKAFPTGINRIDWSKVPGAISTSITTGKVPEARRQQLQQFLRDALLSVGVGESETIIWVGDSTEFVLEMSVATLSESIGILCSYPQHAYVIPSDARWCLNYTIEGEIYFGCAPERKPRRR